MTPTTPLSKSAREPKPDWKLGGVGVPSTQLSRASRPRKCREYGKHGDITTNGHDDQETAVLCLHLLQAALVYVNTLMIQQTLADQNDIILDNTDLRALTPLTYGHVNPYGTFNLDLDTRLALT